MNVENCIEAQYRELMECSEPNAEYADLYKAFTHPHLREILTTLHHDLILLFKRMNDRLPTGECEAHFWADESRELIRRLDIINGLFGALLISQTIDVEKPGLNFIEATLEGIPNQND